MFDSGGSNNGGVLNGDLAILCISNLFFPTKI